MLLNYLKFVLFGDVFEHIYFYCRPIVDYDNENFKI